MDPLIWLIEAVKLNNGYGITRLCSRFQEVFTECDYNSDYISNYLRRQDYKNNWNLYKDIEISDEGINQIFINPLHVDGKGDKILGISPIKIKTEKKNLSNVINKDIIIPKKIQDPKHKIAWLILNHYTNGKGENKLSYYSTSGTVSRPYFIKLAKCLNIELPKNKTKYIIVEEISKQSKIDPLFDEERYFGEKVGSTVKKAFFIDLVNHFQLDIPPELVDRLDNTEEDFKIDIKNWLKPELMTESVEIGELINMYTEGSIYVPTFQRDFRWNLKKQRELIESVLIGIPLPNILLIKSNDGWWLVDGRQRITTLRRFIRPKDERNKFHLGLLTGENSRYTNEYYEDLDESVKSRIIKTKIPITKIKGLENNKSAIYELFRRYNTGGTTLNGAEIRHAVFHENLVHISLFDLAGENKTLNQNNEDTKEVRKLLRIKNGTKGYKTYDLISRYFGYKYCSKDSTSKVIHKVFSDREGEDELEAESYKSEFLETARFCDKLFGNEYRFKKIKENGESSSFSAWAYTVQMIGASFIRKEHPDKKNKIIDRRKEIINLWVEFYDKEIFGQRQNSNTLFDSQHQWELKLEDWIYKNFHESEKEKAINVLKDMDQTMRANYIDKLKKKPYYNEILDLASFERWIK